MTNEIFKKMNISEFAEAVGYSRRQITRYIEQGKIIPRRSLGGLPYFLESDVNKFLTHPSVKTICYVDDVTKETVTKTVPAVLDLTAE